MAEEKVEEVKVEAAEAAEVKVEAKEEVKADVKADAKSSEKKGTKAPFKKGKRPFKKGGKFGAPSKKPAVFSDTLEDRFPALAAKLKKHMEDELKQKIKDAQKDPKVAAASKKFAEK